LKKRKKTEERVWHGEPVYRWERAYVRSSRGMAVIRVPVERACYVGSGTKKCISIEHDEVTVDVGELELVSKQNLRTLAMIAESATAAVVAHAERMHLRREKPDGPK